MDFEARLSGRALTRRRDRCLRLCCVHSCCSECRRPTYDCDRPRCRCVVRCAVRCACTHASMYDEKTPTVRHGMHSTAQRWAVHARVGFCFALLGGLDRMRARAQSSMPSGTRPPTCLCAPEQERGTVQLCEAAAKSATAMRVLWTLRSQVSAAVYSAVGAGGLAQSARADWRCARADQVVQSESPTVPVGTLRSTVGVPWRMVYSRARASLISVCPQPTVSVPTLRMRALIRSRPRRTP